MAVNIVHEEQDISALFVTEILGSSGCSRTNHTSNCRRGVHLTKEHDGIFEHVGIAQGFVELVTLTNALTNATVDGK